MIRCVRGEMTFAVDIAPRFDYGREAHETHVTEDGAVFEAVRHVDVVDLVREPDDAAPWPYPRRLQRRRSRPSSPSAGADAGLVLETGRPARSRRCGSLRRGGSSTRPCEFWRTWLAQSTYSGRWREKLERSAITLKLMTYAPSGGMVAAPTAALPEQIGGERNWDYRYTWVRDASFSVYRCWAWDLLKRRRGWALAGRPGARAGRRRSGPLNIMYRVDGSSDLTEEIITHWEGYRGSSPVRIGNGAAGQLQLDIYGEAIDSLYFGDQRGLERWTPGMAATPRPAGLAHRQLESARGGYLGDSGRPAGFHLRPADELGRLGSGIRLADDAGVPPHWTAGAANETRSTTRS